MPRERTHTESVTELQRGELRKSEPVPGATRAFKPAPTGSDAQRPGGAAGSNAQRPGAGSDAVRPGGGPSHAKPPYHSTDHRFAHPNPAHLRPYPKASGPPPRYSYYRPAYSHWWVHPYYRYHHVTWSVVVGFPFVVYAWNGGWIPPARYGWVWVDGYYAGWWHPGYWRPVGVAPVYYGVHYVYVPGWWQGDLYVEGYWRPDARSDGSWTWVDGYYTEGGAYVRGHWRPANTTPEGYTWEPGFYDGEQWVEGFWRPRFRNGFVWVSSWYGDDGVYHSGYWEPTESRQSQVWIPGWFDGNTWVPGYWVTEEAYRTADPQNYQPEEGWNDGWDDEAAPAVPVDAEGGSEAPLAIPVDPDGGATAEAESGG